VGTVHGHGNPPSPSSIPSVPMEDHFTWWQLVGWFPGGNNSYPHEKFQAFAGYISIA